MNLCCVSITNRFKSRLIYIVNPRNSFSKTTQQALIVFRLAVYIITVVVCAYYCVALEKSYPHAKTQ